MKKHHILDLEPGHQVVVGDGFSAANFGRELDSRRGIGFCGDIAEVIIGRHIGVKKLKLLAKGWAVDRVEPQ